MEKVTEEKLLKSSGNKDPHPSGSVKGTEPCSIIRYGHIRMCMWICVIRAITFFHGTQNKQLRHDI